MSSQHIKIWVGLWRSNSQKVVPSKA